MTNDSARSRSLRSVTSLLCGLLTVMAVASSARAESLMNIGKLSAGHPLNLGQALGPLSYVDVVTYRLARAKLVWINWDYLEERGFDVKNRVLTPEIEKAVLDAFAYSMPNRNDPPDLFTSTKKILMADRYGGDGLAGNMGSGRAASAGVIQIKGVGPTRLVTQEGPSHSNGLMSLDESIREAIYGEVARSLPHGANRVIAIIDRGTRTKNDDGSISTDSLTIREDSLRPAHYMRNLWGRGPLMDSEEARTAEALRHFFIGFPVPEGFKAASLPERTRAAVFAYSDRLAEQYAASFARRFFHGATSPSNIESSGREIDYGTATTVPDYGLLKTIPNNDYNGEIEEFKSTLLIEVLGNFRANMASEMSSRLPTDEELKVRFTSEYGRQLRREWLRLAGFSKSDIDSLAKSEQGLALADAIHHLATMESKKALDPQTETRLTKYNLNRILVKIAGAPSTSEASLNQTLSDENPGDTYLHQNFVRVYSAVLSSFSKAERTQILSAAMERNADHPEAYRWKLWKTGKLLDRYYVLKNRGDLIRSTIDSIAARFPKATPVRPSCPLIW